MHSRDYSRLTTFSQKKKISYSKINNYGAVSNLWVQQDRALIGSEVGCVTT